jgi:hypothetical protein
MPPRRQGGVFFISLLFNFYDIESDLYFLTGRLPNIKDIIKVGVPENKIMTFSSEFSEVKSGKAPRNIRAKNTQEKNVKMDEIM